MTYVITATHHMYAPARDVTDIAGGDGAPAIYGTRAEAQAALDDIEGAVYYTRYNETGRPTYRIRTVASLSQALRCQL